MDHLGSRPLIDLLSDLFGSSWVLSAHRSATSTSGPATIDFSESAWNFQQTLELTHALGLDTFFNIWVSEDDKQPTQNILQVVTVVQHCQSVHIFHMSFSAP